MSAHSAALTTLRAWLPPSAGQAVLRDRYVDHLLAHGDGLTRRCVPDHLTASTLVLSADSSAVLLTLHAKARRWFQFGGHVEPSDDTLAHAALREATEESGVADLRLDPTPVQLSEHEVRFCGPTGDVHHLDVRFLAVARNDAEHTLTDESLDVRWWPVEDVARLEPELVELVELARHRAQSPAPSSRAPAE